ncbi:IS3 family transposase [Mannheimia granulomatis]
MVKLSLTMWREPQNYNNEHIQVKLKGLSPVEYRTQSLN